MAIVKKLLQNLTVSLFSFVTVFFLIEICLRIAFFLNFDVSAKRFLVWSSPVFNVDSSGAVTFAKNASIREVAVYNGTIEYDMMYKTNNFGFVDSVNYEKNIGTSFTGRQYAFVGDSFAVGAGGYSWISDLRDRMFSETPDVRIYNFGLLGAGGWHFLKILETMSRNFEFTDIVILAISSDMYRDYWTPVLKNSSVSFCPVDAVTKEVRFNIGPVGTIIDKNATEAEILKHVHNLEIQEKRAGLLSFKKLLFLSLIKKSLRSFISRPVSEKSVYFAPFAKMRALFPSVRIYFEPLAKIRALFPKARIYFIHLPEKDEVAKGKYAFELKDQIESLGIKYYPALYERKWSVDMYYKNDAHPNRLGYGAILDCVEKYISREWYEK